MKTMQKDDINIRDNRGIEWYWSNNEFLDNWAEKVGVSSVAVYSVLCRHANNENQSCFPSMETITKKAGLKSRKATANAIKILEKFNIIRVEIKFKQESGKRENNTYYLIDKKSWGGRKEPKILGVKIDEIIIDEVKEPVKKETVMIEPEWLDKKMWSEWVKYRKEMKQTLKDTTIKFQWKFLEKYKEYQADIITKSIQNGWQGLFPPRIEKGQKVASGKYSHLT